MKLSVPLKKAECFAKQRLSDVINALACLLCLLFLLAELNGYHLPEKTSYSAYSFVNCFSLREAVKTEGTAVQQ